MSGNASPFLTRGGSRQTQVQATCSAHHARRSTERLASSTADISLHELPDCNRWTADCPVSVHRRRGVLLKKNSSSTREKGV